MAIKSGFFNSVNGDRRYKADFFAEYFASFIGNGVFPNPSTGMQVIAGDGMQTVIKAGKAWINGYYAVNDDDYIMQHDIADGVLKRIDRIVLRLDFSLRDIITQVKKGSFASNPVAPTLQRDADAYEIALADVLINNGAISITQANITDLRLNTHLCGIVHGTVNQVDTTTIFNQYQAWFNSVKDGVDEEIEAWQTEKYAEFETWLADLQAMLDGDVATNLANRITTLDQGFNEHVEDEERHISVAERVKWNSTEMNLNRLRKSRSNKDSNGTYTEVNYLRPDGSLYAKSVLSGGTANQYSTNTITYYAGDGTTVLLIDVIPLSYDADGDLISEV